MCTSKNVLAASNNSILLKSYCQNGDRRSLFITFSKLLLLVSNLPQMFFYPKFDCKIIDLAIYEKYFQEKSADNWNPYFGQHGGTDSNDNNSLDFHRKNSKFVLKLKHQMFTSSKVQTASKNFSSFKSYCRNSD